MTCFYNFNGKDSLSLDNIVEAYYKSGALLTNKNIYSTEEIVDSTYNKIMSQVERKDEILKQEKTALTTFISQENEALLRALGKEKTRFSPEYTEDKRVLKFIKDSMIDAGTLPNTEETRDKTLKELEGLDGFKDFKKDIETVIEGEKKANILLAGLKAAIFKALKNYEDITSLENYIRPILGLAVDRSIEDGLIAPVDRAAMIDKLIISAEKIINIVNASGRAITDITLTTEPGNAQQITGNIDIITIDNDGVPSIFSIRSSKRDYDKWDSAKKLNSDYQLAFQRALLGQYVNTNQTKLIVIPLQTGDIINGMLSPSGFFTGDAQIRSGEPRSGLGYGEGELFHIANAIIPSRVHLDYNPERLEKIYGDLKLLLPGYKVRTSSRTFNEEIAIKNILSKNSFTADLNKEFMIAVDKDVAKKYGLRAFENKLVVDQLNAAQAKEVIDLYLSFVDTQLNQSIVKLKNSIVTVIANQDSSELKLYNDDQTIYVNKVLMPYLNGSYRVLDSIRELDELGIILMQNNVTGGIVAINVSANNFKAKDSNGREYGTLEYFKVLTVLNNLYDELRLNVNTVQSIVILDLDNKTAPKGNIADSFESYSNLATSKSYSLKLTSSIIPSIEDTIQHNLYAMLQTYNLSDKEEMLRTFQGITTNVWDTDVDTLTRIYRELRQKFPTIAQKTINPDLNFSDPREYIFTLVNILLLTKKGLLPKGDANGLRNFALGYQDWFGVIKAFYSKDLWSYNKNEDTVTGFLAGLKMITPDKVQSEDLRAISNIISGSIDMLAHEILRRAEKVQLSTVNYYKKIGYGGVVDNIVGDHRKVFKNLWVHDGNKLSNKWSTKNPYAFTQGNELKEEERQYLKEVLFHIQRQLMKIPNEIANKIDISSLESIKKTAPPEWATKILESIHIGEYFRMPLIRSQYLSRNKKLFSTDPEDLKEWLSTSFAEIKDFLNPEELTPEDRAKVDDVIKDYYEMYDVYGNQSAQFISDEIDKNPDYYEIDLDSIAHTVIQSKVKIKYVNQVLPTINSFMWWIKLSGAMVNKNVSKELQWVQDRVKLSFFDKTLVDKEVEDIITAANVAKRITTAGMLAFRPVFLFKEGIIGLYKGVSIAATKYFGKDQFTLQDYTRAMKELTVVDNKFSTKFNLLDKINHFYRFANLDINSYSKKIQTNRRGLLMGLSKYMYSMNTIPDYYNRLSLFLAKMIHEGSYDAHSLDKDGLLVYDPTKDGRFEYYFKNREKHLNPVVGAKEKYIPAENDKKYNEQRNLYLLVMSEINDSKRLVGEKEFTEEDHIDQAYSEKERQSYKTFTDTVYGYYDKEAAPSWHYAWYGIIFLQFMQFWPGKMSVWFSNPTENVGGKHRQKTTLDKNGKRVPVWRKVTIDDDGNVTIEPTLTNTGDPLLEWVGNTHEGVVFSFAKTVQDVVKGMGMQGKSWSEVRDQMLEEDEQRLSRVKYGLADGLLMMLVFSMLKVIFDMMFGDQTEGLGNETRKFGNSLNTKLISEANLPQNTILAIRGDFLPWTYATKIVGDVHSMMNDNKTFGQVMSNIRAFEFLNDPTQK